MTKIDRKITATAQAEEAGLAFDYLSLEDAIIEVEGARDILLAISNKDAIEVLTAKGVTFIWQKLDAATEQLRHQFHAYCEGQRAMKSARVSVPAGE